jgi:hypothetical protein
VAELSRVEQIKALLDEHAEEIARAGSVKLTFDCPPEGQPTLKVEKVYRSDKKSA